MKKAFTYSCPTQVHFGVGVSKTLSSLLPMEAESILLVRGQSGQASAPILELLNKTRFRIMEVSCDGEPTVESINAAMGVVKGRRPNAIISCGGGAVIDVGKVICFALANNLHNYDDVTKVSPVQMNTQCETIHIAIPTTAGTGAEVTANAVIGVPNKGAKISLRGRGIFPTVALIDPDLMRNAPRSVILHAGMDAVTQILESYTSNAATPFSDALTSSVRFLGLPALKKILDDGDTTAMNNLAWVSHLSGLALANSGLGAAHGLASVIGGRFKAPHGALCGRLLPLILEKNLTCAPIGSDIHLKLSSCIKHIESVFPITQKNSPMSGLTTWLDMQGLPRLADWSVTKDDLVSIADQGRLASSSQKNAVPLNSADYLDICQSAF